MAFSKEEKRERRRALQPAFPRPDGRAPSGCSWDKENGGGWLRQDGSEWTAVRNEKRTLERAEKKARERVCACSSGDRQYIDQNTWRLPKGGHCRWEQRAPRISKGHCAYSRIPPHRSTTSRMTGPHP